MTVTLEEPTTISIAGCNKLAEGAKSSPLYVKGELVTFAHVGHFTYPFQEEE